LIPSEDRGAIVALLEEGMSRGVSAKAMAGLFGLAARTLRRWGLMIRAQGFSRDQRKGATRHVIHRFSEKERQRVLFTVNDPCFADLTPSQIVAILAEEGLLNHRGRTRLPREPREPPMLEATGIHQVLAWDITLLPGPVKGQFFYLYIAMDAWSRRILGVEVDDRECGELAKHFFYVVSGIFSPCEPGSMALSSGTTLSIVTAASSL
jgi:putative transposase